MVVDFVVICATFLAAYLLVIGGLGSEFERSVFLAALPILLATRYVSFVALGVYRRVWRFATARDVIPIALGCVVSAVVAFLVLVALRDIGSFPALEVFVVDAVLCTLLVGASRLTLRLLPEARARGRDRRRVLVVGAGRAGAGWRASYATPRKRGSSASSTTTLVCGVAGSSASPWSARSTRLPGRSPARGPTRCSSPSRTRRRSGWKQWFARRRRPGVPCRIVRRVTEFSAPEQPVEVSLP